MEILGLEPEKKYRIVEIMPRSGYHKEILIPKTMQGKLKKLEHDRYVAEKKLTAAQHREKRLRNELKLLTRNERTHRLCTRAGMLETFLREPTLLTDDDVMELLRFIFHGEAVQKKLDMLIESRKKMLETEVAENT